MRSDARGEGRTSILYTVCCILVCALFPRLWAIDAFLTPDERRWLERSVRFLASLLVGNPVGTLLRGHPGVTTMWAGSTGLVSKFLAEGWPLTRESLWDFLRYMPTEAVQLDYILALRWPIALFTSLGVVAIYLLVKRLFGKPVALLSAALIAFDPFYLAHSRFLHHDALVSTFMSLSLLTLLVYLWRGGQQRYLALSGLCCGLALLSKSTAVFLLPFAGLLFLWSWAAGGRKESGRWLARFFLLGAVAVAAFVLLWPAMWVSPEETLTEMEEKASGMAGVDHHPTGDFFLGQPTLVAKALAYPLMTLLRLTPLTLAGLALAAFLGRGYLFTSEGRKTGLAGPAFSLAAYVALFTLFMTLGGVRYDRYLLPIYPSVEILAALGLTWLGRSLAHVRCPALLKCQAPLAVAVLALQAAFALPHVPYYLTFYNPLVGGGHVAPKLTLVGWGEGLDEVARYLNAKPEVEKTKVAIQYPTEFAPFYRGEALPLRAEDEAEPPPWEQADYVVFYLPQVQSLVPDEAVVRRFQSLRPERIIRLKGIDYAWIYGDRDGR
ncbi:MAG: ArnT family glycosyltransferase [Anaerolineae bacterium]